MCSVVDNRTFVLSYQPREAMLLFSKSSSKRSVPPGGGGGGGACTFSVAVPVFVSLVAVIVVDPAPTPLTKPVELTVATPGFALAHVTTRPVSTLLLASRMVAES
jgi:hypothetical protein